MIVLCLSTNPHVNTDCMNVEKLGYSVEKAKKKPPNKHFPMAQVKIFKARLKKISAFTSKNQTIGSTNVANKLKDAVLN